MKKKITSLFLSLIALSATVFTAHAAERLLIIGDATPAGWSIDNALVMIQSPENPDIFTYTGYLKADADFKFTSNTFYGDADLEYRNASEDAYEATTLMKGGDDRKFRVREAANYDIVCDLSNLSISVTKSEYQENPIRYNILYLIGGATVANWNLSQAVPMQQDANNPFILSVTTDLVSGTFKIATNCHVGYDQDFFHPEADDQTKLTLDGTDDRQWQIEEEDSYIVKLNLLDQTISITKNENTAIEGISIDNQVQDPVYYNLQGVRVNTPSKGIYIEVRGNKVSKVCL